MGWPHLWHTHDNVLFGEIWFAFITIYKNIIELLCMYLVKFLLSVVSWCAVINTLRPRQNGHHFTDDTFKYFFWNENVVILAKTSLRFVSKDPINNIPALVQIMAWRWPGDKPLSEPMVVRLPTHICVTQPQWVKANLWIPSGAICSLFDMENYTAATGIQQWLTPIKGLARVMSCTRH